MRQLTVLIQTDDTEQLEVLGHAFDALVELRERLLAESALSELSFLRGNLGFCVTSLKKQRGYPVLVILDGATYADPTKLNAVIAASPADVYNYTGTTVEEIVKRVENCVRDFLKFQGVTS